MSDEYPLLDFTIEFSTSQPARNLTGTFHALVPIDEYTELSVEYKDKDGIDRLLFLGIPQKAEYLLKDGASMTDISGLDLALILSKRLYEAPADPDADITEQFRLCVEDLLEIQGINLASALPYGDTLFNASVLDPSENGTEWCYDRIQKIVRSADGIFLIRYEDYSGNTVVMPHLVKSTMLDTFLISKSVSAITIPYASCLEEISVNQDGVIPYYKIIVLGPSELNETTGLYERQEAIAYNAPMSSFPLTYVETIDRLPTWATDLAYYAAKRLADLNRARYTFPVTLAGLWYAELYQPVTLTGFPLDIITAGGFRVIGVKWVRSGEFFETTLTVSNAVISGSSNAAYSAATGFSWDYPGNRYELIAAAARAAVRTAPTELIGDKKIMACMAKETDTVTGVTTVDTHIGTTQNLLTPYTDVNAISPSDQLLAVPVGSEVIAVPITNAPVFGEYKPSSAGSDTNGDYIDIYVPDHLDADKRTLRVRMPNLDPATLRDYEKIHAIPVGRTYYGSLAEPARAVLGTITEIDGVTGLAKATDLKDETKTYEGVIPYSEDMTWT